MNLLTARLGYWSAVLSFLLNIVYTAGIGLVISSPLPQWVNLNDFLAKADPNALIGYTISQISSFILAPLCVVLFSCLHEYAPESKKVLTRIGFGAILGTTILGNQMYFIHFSMTGLHINQGDLNGLDHLLEWNTGSALSASGALGWTFFAGLAFLVVAPIFSAGKLERGIKITFLTYGVFALFGMAGFLLGNINISGLSILVAILSSTVMALLLALLFGRIIKTIPPASGTIHLT